MLGARHLGLLVIQKRMLSIFFFMSEEQTDTGNADRRTITELRHIYNCLTLFLFTDGTPKLQSIMMSLEYILLIIFLAVYNLRLWFYVGNLNSYLEFMSDSDMDTGNVTSGST